MAETSALITVNYLYLIVYKNRVFSLEKRAEKLFHPLIAIFKWDNSNKNTIIYRISPIFPFEEYK